MARALVEYMRSRGRRTAAEREQEEAAREAVRADEPRTSDDDARAIIFLLFHLSRY